jgi:hypothetical protein
MHVSNAAMLSNYLQFDFSVCGARRGMELWDYLLTADRRLDLADPDRALDWLRHQPFGFRDSWPEGATENWTAGILALRLLARRVKGRKVRRVTAAAIKEKLDRETEADLRLNRYLAMMRPTREQTESGLLTASNNRGIRLRAAYPLPTPVPLDERGNKVLTHKTITFADLAVPELAQLVLWTFGRGEPFWQLVFHDLVSNEKASPTVCQRCGAFLGEDTVTGRRVRAEWCPRCRWQNWQAKQSADAKHKRWRSDYAKRKSKTKPKRKRKKETQQQEKKRWQNKS